MLSSGAHFTLVVADTVITETAIAASWFLKLLMRPGKKADTIGLGFMERQVSPLDFNAALDLLIQALQL